ncbi:MAG: hypothetical protein QOJ35_2976 [Solirubrobacteraceae bacterium]|jgi:hypothetical protein|nr:hypothetical protein [Solirubrobacteraceae bacterium]
MSGTLDGGGWRIAAAFASMVGLALCAAAPALARPVTAAACTVTLPTVSITPPFQPLFRPRSRAIACSRPSVR